MDRPLAERFAAKVEMAQDDCWLWIGALSTNGYGVIRDGNSNSMAHRVSYEMFVGPVPEGCELDHLCRVRRCVNPSHLEPVSHRENVLRGQGVAAINARRTHCQFDHPFDEENTRIMSNGTRACRQCIRDRKRERRCRRG